MYLSVSTSKYVEGVIRFLKACVIGRHDYDRHVVAKNVKKIDLQLMVAFVQYSNSS